MKKISVCVPAYNRPDTLAQLIHSFLLQTYSNKELVISDDTSNNTIEKLVKSYNSSSIKYFRNNPALRFSKNLLASMKRSTGDFLVLMGDDDILMRKNVLKLYVDAFTKNPSVGFVYSNQVQFSPKMNVEYIITHFTEEKLLSKGNEAMEKIWIRSIFIGGIGIRNSKNLTAIYPQKKILHPQVEFVGNIINTADAYTLKEYCIGVRSHDDQIIFRALKDKKIRQQGDHMTVELFAIFKYLKKKYSLSISDDFLGNQLAQLYTVVMFKEKSVLGRATLRQNYQQFVKLSDSARASIRFRIAYCAAMIIPGSIISILRASAIQILRTKNHATFYKYKKIIMKMGGLH